jgi:hypothetical protein
MLRHQRAFLVAVSKVRNPNFNNKSIMNLIATRDFRNTHNLTVDGSLHPLHVHKGATLTIDERAKGGWDLIAILNTCGLIVDTKDVKTMTVLNEEIAADRKRIDSDSRAGDQFKRQLVGTKAGRQGEVI